MAQEFRDVLAGFHVWFFRDGDAFINPAPGICGIESKPGIDPDFDPGWLELGDVETFEPGVTQTDIKLYKPAPAGGHVVLKNLLETKQELMGKLTVNNLSAIQYELAFRTAQKLGGAQKQFNQLSAVSRRGWVHFEGYDQDDAVIGTMDWYVRARATMKFVLGEPAKPEVELFNLYSSLGTGWQPFA